MKPSQEHLRRMMRDKSDEELYLLVHIHSEDYTSETVEAAREEFSHREPDAETMSRIRFAAAEALRARGGKPGEGEAKGKMAHWSWRDSDLKVVVTAWLYVTLFLLVCYAIYGGYEWFDSAGWISHSEDTVITAGSNWLIGESKGCFSMPLNAASAAQLGKPVGYAMPSIKCDDGPEHRMKVTFYGRRVQAEYSAVSWSCTKGMISFTCYQKGGER